MKQRIIDWLQKRSDALVMKMDQRYLVEGSWEWQAMMEIHALRLACRDAHNVSAPLMAYRVGMRYMAWCKHRNHPPVYPVLEPIAGWNKKK